MALVLAVVKHLGGEVVDQVGDEFLQRVVRAWLKSRGLGAPLFPYEVESDLSARTEWLTTQYFDTTEEEKPHFPWAPVSQDMSLRYLGSWDLDDGFTDEMFSQFYMAGSDTVALAQLCAL